MSHPKWISKKAARVDLTRYANKSTKTKKLPYWMRTELKKAKLMALFVVSDVETQGELRHFFPGRKGVSSLLYGNTNFTEEEEKNVDEILKKHGLKIEWISDPVPRIKRTKTVHKVMAKEANTESGIQDVSMVNTKAEAE